MLKTVHRLEVHHMLLRRAFASALLLFQFYWPEGPIFAFCVREK